MNRVRVAVAATLFTTVGLAAAAAQSAPPMQSVLAGKKVVPPLRGEATVEFTQPVTKRNGASVVTTMKVKNASQSPIARLMVTETWYDKAGAIVAGGRGVVNGLLQPGEIQTITITTPFNDKMSANNWNFTHANGTVKPAKVKALDAPKDAAAAKEPATKPAAAPKK